ncbi:hypothetical protein GQ457_01G002050 [Hibiscus cannabinus]
MAGMNFSINLSFEFWTFYDVQILERGEVLKALRAHEFQIQMKVREEGNLIPLFFLEKNPCLSIFRYRDVEESEVRLVGKPSSGKDMSALQWFTFNSLRELKLLMHLGSAPIFLQQSIDKTLRLMSNTAVVQQRALGVQSSQSDRVNLRDIVANAAITHIR